MTKKKKLVAISFALLCALVVAAVVQPLLRVARAYSVVPDWFQDNERRPYKIFDAWKHLSTREAALYLRPKWETLAGVLQDEHGNPMPHTPISFNYDAIIRGYSSRLVTDAKGLFVIYGPYKLEERIKAPHSTFGFSAISGYPASDDGWAYAQSRKEVQKCGLEMVMKEKDKAFYVLTAPKANTFSKVAFKQWQGDARKRDTRVIKPWRDTPRPIPVEQDSNERVKNIYRLQVLSPQGEGVPKANVKASLFGNGGGQVVQTDAMGRCEMVEHLRIKETPDYFAEARKQRQQLTVDAPSYGAGPIHFELQKGTTNVIKLDAPATVSGRITDHKGNMIWTRVSIRYKKFSIVAFEGDVTLQSDGTFSFSRIMPNMEFKILAENISMQNTPIAPVETGYMMLKPGEKRTDISMVVPQAAAVRGIILDETNKPVETVGGVSLMSDDGSGKGASEGSKFGFSGIGQKPFRLRVYATGFEEYWSAKMQLEPGELRFVKIILKPKSSPEFPVN